jgi:hypothetical protein
VHTRCRRTAASCPVTSTPHPHRRASVFRSPVGELEVRQRRLCPGP